MRAGMQQKERKIERKERKRGEGERSRKDREREIMSGISRSWWSYTPTAKDWMASHKNTQALMIQI